MKRLESLRRSLSSKKCVKVIAGINNFDVEQIKKVISAADQGGASAIDISAREDILFVAREMTDMPIFVSSVVPEELAMAARNGATALEIGNYDALYAENRTISTSEIREIASRTIELVRSEGRREDVLVCVTVPGHIEISEQIRLAVELEEMGVDMIQTEGSAFVDVQTSGARALLEKAQVSISNTIELARNIEIPVMTASGITSTTANMAFAAGASAIGVGSCVNKLSTNIEMIAIVRSIVSHVNEFRPSREASFA